LDLHLGILSRSGLAISDSSAESCREKPQAFSTAIYALSRRPHRVRSEIKRFGGGSAETDVRLVL
jgi:hypothetical protein